LDRVFFIATKTTPNEKRRHGLLHSAEKVWKDTATNEGFGEMPEDQVHQRFARMRTGYPTLASLVACYSNDEA
jgi:hypothetical protein